MNGRWVACEYLAPAERDAMFALLCAHFDGVTRAQFEADLAEKTAAVLLHDEARRLRGFSTVLSYTTRYQGRRIGVVCSGDTIVDPDAWGSSALFATWLPEVFELKRQSGCDEFYWLLICSGYRTYRFLPVFWRRFFPHFRWPTPAAAGALKDHLAVERWGDAYDPGSGIVHLKRPQLLKRGISPVTGARMRDPNVQFFTRSNPGHARGDELVCLTPVDRANLRSSGLRFLGDGVAVGAGRARA
jgi:hypothetical protein